MFKRIRAMLGRSQPAPEPQKEPSLADRIAEEVRAARMGEFGDIKRSSAEIVAGRMELLRALEPKLYAHPVSADIEGEGMDAAEDGDELLVDLFGTDSDNGYTEADLVTSGTDYDPFMAADYQSAGLSPEVVGFFANQTFIGYQLAALLSTHWLIAKCCWMPARDATRKGYSINCDGVDGDEVVKQLTRADKRFQIRKATREIVGFGKTFGIRVAIFRVELGSEEENREYYENPFNIDALKPGSYRGITQVDPYYVTPELDAEASVDPSSIHFREPTWWVINGKRYHRSHCIVYREGDITDIMKSEYMYGGVPVPQKVVERVYCAERTANEAPELAMAKRLITMKVDLEKMRARGPAAFSEVAQFSSRMNNYGIQLVGHDDDVTTSDTALGDFDTLTMTQYQLIASAANVPATKLYGTSPKGFGASGEYEISSYHEELESIQAEFLTPMVERHHLMVIQSEIMPDMRSSNGSWKKPHVDVSWLPLDTPSAKEQAETNETKARYYQELAGTGAIDGVDIRDALINDPNSGLGNLQGTYRDTELPEMGKVRHSKLMETPAPAADAAAPDMTMSNPFEDE